MNIKIIINFNALILHNKNEMQVYFDKINKKLSLGGAIILKQKVLRWVESF